MKKIILLLVSTLLFGNTLDKLDLKNDLNNASEIATRTKLNINKTPAIVSVLHADELKNISSHGLSYLILCVFFIALVNMIRKKQQLNIIWPMDELKELHQSNIEVLVDILSNNNITLLSAFPDPDPEVLSLFTNRYQIIGDRELLEMEIDEDYMETLEPLREVENHV